MNMQPGDWVVLTGEKWGDNAAYYSARFAINEIFDVDEFGKIAFEKERDFYWYIDDDGDFAIQHIQDYFQPGDEMRTEWPDGAACSSIISKWDGDKVWFVEGTYHKLPFDGFIVRNLTKEKQEKEANMPKENNNCCKNIPHELTVDDLYLTAKTPACPPTRQRFIETFGFKVQLNDPKLKDWILDKNLKKDIQDNLPDHYAVIFPEWQPTINEIVWYINKPQIIGRVYKIKNRWMDILWQSDDKLKAFNISDIKPISERPFQVGDYVKGKWTNHMYEVISDEKYEENSHQIKESEVKKGKALDLYDLIISPAIPEVK